MREIWFGLIVVLALAGPAPAFAQPAGPAPSPALTAPPTAAATKAKLLEVGANDRVFGKAGAPITIVEYASLTCPHCAHFETEVLPKLKEKWIDPGKVRLVLRDYPLDEPALRAAIVARCLPAEKFYGFIEALFAQQQQWVLSKDYKAALARIAALGGVGKTQFDACLANKDLENQVLESRLVASQDLGVQSTPTFFINGTQFNGAPTVEEFDAVLSRLPSS